MEKVIEGIVEQALFTIVNPLDSKEDALVKEGTEEVDREQGPPIELEDIHDIKEHEHLKPPEEAFKNKKEPEFQWNLEGWMQHKPDLFVEPLNCKQTKIEKVLMLYNAKAGAQKGKDIQEQTREMLETAGVTVQRIPLERKNHATELCATMDLSDIDAVLAVGGDGTLHECVNGLMQRKDKEILSRVPLVTIPAGTGNSFAHELYGGVELERVVNRVIRGIHLPIDLALIKCENGETFYSFNSIHWGLGAKVVVTAEKLRWLGNVIRYTTASLLELVRGEDIPVTLKIVDKKGNNMMLDEKLCLVIANNIRSAANMQIAPDAKLNDGLLDLILIKSSKVLNLANVFSKLYSGEHTDLDFVEYLQVKSFEIIPTESTDSGVEEMLDIDGELKGNSPFSCEVVPSAIRIIV